MAQDLPALQYALDTDALNTLITTSTPRTLSFVYAAYHVHITRDTITISPATTPS